jgi:hypothetical protein
MTGHIRRRAKNSWRLKFDAGRDADGNRKTQYHTFRGSKREAQVKLAELIASVATNVYVEPNKITVAEFVRNRIEQWEAAGDITARTAARYRELAENQIAPHLGSNALQKLRPLDIEEWHTTLRKSVGAAWTLSATLSVSATRWRRQRRTAYGLSRQSQRRAAAISHCRRFCSISCESIARRSWNCASSLALAACRMMPCCLATLMATRPLLTP